MEMGISAGANLGDRLAALREACRRVAGLPGVRLAAVSSLYETEPVDVPAESRSLLFLNAAWVIETSRAPADLLGSLHAIETALGRRRSANRHAPRLIDLDLLYAGQLTITEPSLVLPHPRWAQRRFAALPLAEIRPDLILPGQGHTARNIAASLPERPRAWLVLRNWTDLHTQPGDFP